MKCDKPVIEAFNGIKFTHKLDDTLLDMSPKTKLNSKELEGYLKKRGVSSKEIEQSNILLGSEDKLLRRTPKEWLDLLNQLGNPHHIHTISGGKGYSEITLGKEGVDNPTYKEELNTIIQPTNNAPDMPHYEDKVTLDSVPSPSIAEFKSTDTPEIRDIKEELSYIENKRDELYEKLFDLNQDPIDILTNPEYARLGHVYDDLMEKLNVKLNGPDKGSKSLLGWIRYHISDVNGKKSTVLNELQSDWAKIERDKGGRFEKTQKEIDELEKILEDTDEFTFSPESGEILFTGKAKKAKERLNKLKRTRNKLVADFPMSPEKYTQYQIAQGINRAIENGTNRLVIPIERGNELMGQPGVTKFYSRLNPTNEEAIQFVREQQIKKVYGDPALSHIDKSKVIEKIREYGIADEDKKVRSFIDKSTLNVIKKKLEKQGFKIKIGKEEYIKSPEEDNVPLHIIEIEKIPKGGGKLDIYSILGLSVGGYEATKEQ